MTPPAPRWRRALDRGWRWWSAPQPLARLVALRILVPLWVLGFMSSRIAHADYWIGDRGFVIPETGSWQEPLHLPRLPGASAWALVTVMVVAGLAFAAGLRTRLAGLIFAATLFWVAFADRMQAYTVSKLGPVLVLALCATPCGARTGVDAWLAGRRDPTRPRPTHTTWGNVRFFQALLVVFYAASGLCKARGDWLHRDDVLWTLIHDTYQTPVTLLFANHAPTWSWAILQWTTLVYEGLAPIWFALRWTRPFALGYGLAMHLMIGLMFGPVIWFSLLMMTVLAACFLPARRLEQALRWPVAGREPAGGPEP